MRICTVIDSLRAGGAERVMSTISNGLVASGHSVTVVTVHSPTDDFFSVDPRVRRRCIGPMPVPRNWFWSIWVNVRLVVLTRRAVRLERPEVVLSFIDRTNVTTLLALAGMGIPVVVSERNDPRQREADPVTRLLRKVCYRRAAAVVVQTESVATWARTFLASKKVVVLPNPAPWERPPRLCPTSHGPLKLVAMSRLVPQKRLGILIEAVDLLDDDVDWSLSVVGDGPERRLLEREVARRGLSERVTFLGALEAPEPVLGGADVFVLSSQFEGFPNALLEAMSIGLAVVSTRCPSGPEDMIDDGRNGLLVDVDDPVAMSRAIRSLTDDALRRRLGAAAAQDSERYRPSKIVRRWEDLLASSILRSGH